MSFENILLLLHTHTKRDGPGFDKAEEGMSFENILSFIVHTQTKRDGPGFAKAEPTSLYEGRGMSFENFFFFFLLLMYTIPF